MSSYSVTYENTYITPSSARSLLGLLHPNAAFYPSMLGTVYRTSRIAKAGNLDDVAWANSSQEIIAAFERAGCTFHFENLEGFTGFDGPCVVIGNHMSTLETFALPAMLQPHKDIAFVVKQSLAEYPFFRWVIKATNPIIVGRSNPRDDLKTVINGGVSRLEKGRSVIVFPQSTRSVTLDTQKFNTIGIKLAKHAGVPVVPLALKTDAWSMGNVVKDFGDVIPWKTIRFRFGNPMAVEGNGKNQHAAICDFITSALEEWRDETADSAQ